MTKVWVFLALTPLAFSCAASSGAELAKPNSLPQCEIRSTAISGGQRLEGVVRGVPGEVGSYRFMLEKNGTDGNSKIGQGGEFSIAPSGENIVAMSELSMVSSDTYRANMTVTGLQGAMQCSRAQPSR